MTHGEVGGPPARLEGFRAKKEHVRYLLSRMKCLVNRYLFRIQITQVVSWHVLCETNGLVTNGDSLLYNLLELIFGMARAELARVGVHCERHC